MALARPILLLGQCTASLKVVIRDLHHNLGISATDAIVADFVSNYEDGTPVLDENGNITEEVTSELVASLREQWMTGDDVNW